MKKLLPSVNCEKKNHYISCIDMVSLQCKFFDEHEDYLFTDDNTRQRLWKYRLY